MNSHPMTDSLIVPEGMDHQRLRDMSPAERAALLERKVMDSNVDVVEGMQILEVFGIEAVKRAMSANSERSDRQYSKCTKLKPFGTREYTYLYTISHSLLGSISGDHHACQQLHDRYLGHLQRFLEEDTLPQLLHHKQSLRGIEAGFCSSTTAACPPATQQYDLLNGLCRAYERFSVFQLWLRRVLPQLDKAPCRRGQRTLVDTALRLFRYEALAVVEEEALEAMRVHIQWCRGRFCAEETSDSSEEGTEAVCSAVELFLRLGEACDVSRRHGDAPSGHWHALGPRFVQNFLTQCRANYATCRGQWLADLGLELELCSAGVNVAAPTRTRSAAMGMKYRYCQRAARVLNCERDMCQRYFRSDGSFDGVLSVVIQELLLHTDVAALLQASFDCLTEPFEAETPKAEASTFPKEFRDRIGTLYRLLSFAQRYEKDAGGSGDTLFRGFWAALSAKVTGPWLLAVATPNLPVDKVEAQEESCSNGNGTRSSAKRARPPADRADEDCRFICRVLAFSRRLAHLSSECFNNDPAMASLRLEAVRWLMNSAVDRNAEGGGGKGAPQSRQNMQDRRDRLPADMLAVYLDRLIKSSQTGPQQSLELPEPVCVGNEPQKSGNDALAVALECVRPAGSPMFWCLEDKDAFMQSFRRLLGARILGTLAGASNRRGGASTSAATLVESERPLIGALKEAMGGSYVSRCECMLQDALIAEETRAKFLAECKYDSAEQSGYSFDFSVLLLTNGVWDSQHVGGRTGLATRRSSSNSAAELEAIDNTIKLPPSMQQRKDSFVRWYATAHAKRRLRWFYSTGEVIVRANFPEFNGNTSSGRAMKSDSCDPASGTRVKEVSSYEFSVVPAQAVVLLAFNEESSTDSKEETWLSVQQLSALTGLPAESDLLKRALHSLSSNKSGDGRFQILLKQSGHSVAAGSTVSPSTLSTSCTEMYAYNARYHCPVKRVTIPMPSGAISRSKSQSVALDGEDSDGCEDLTPSRIMAVEAAVVRIMKAKKTASHNELIVETAGQLPLFKAALPILKRAIEKLIEREYLERDGTNPQMYRYMA